MTAARALPLHEICHRRVASVSSGAPVFPLPVKHGTATLGKSAKFVTARKLDLAATRAEVRRLAPETIWGAFPAASQHQVCKGAAKATGASADTFDRLLNGFTATPDLILLVHVARIYTARTGKQSPLAALIARLVAP